MFNLIDLVYSLESSLTGLVFSDQLKFNLRLIVFISLRLTYNGDDSDWVIDLTEQCHNVLIDAQLPTALCFYEHCRLVHRHTISGIL